MTPKEKSWEIFYKFKTIPDKWKDEKVFQNYYAKQCALIAVDEILNSRVGYPYPKDLNIEVKGFYNQINYPKKYWQEVKQEIEKL